MKTQINQNRYVKHNFALGLFKTVFLAVFFFAVFSNFPISFAAETPVPPPGIVDNIDWQSSSLETIEGKIMLGQDNQPCIVAKWTSRSRVSYYLYGDLKTQFSTAVDKFARIRGWILKNPANNNPWTKKILIESVIIISSNPEFKN